MLLGMFDVAVGRSFLNSEATSCALRAVKVGLVFAVWTLNLGVNEATSGTGFCTILVSQSVRR